MTSPPEKPICCPCCFGKHIAIRQDSPNYGEGECFTCGCTWPTHKRRAQPAMDEREAFEKWFSENKPKRYRKPRHDSWWHPWLARAKVRREDD